MSNTNPFDDDFPDESGGFPSDPLGVLDQSNMKNLNDNMNMMNLNSHEGNMPYSEIPSTAQNQPSTMSHNNRLPTNMNRNTYHFSSDPNVAATNVEDENMPVEASWQFLGELPYRRVPIFQNVTWRDSESSEKSSRNSGYKSGLAAFPPSWIKARQESSSSSVFSENDIKQLLRTTTVTKVAGCPNGGPIAVMTLPLPTASLSNQSNSFKLTTTELRIMMPSGRLLTRIDFPPPNLLNRVTNQPYSAADVLDIGFTDRTLLMVVMRDSTCLTYNLRGQFVFNPFRILTQQQTGNVELMEAAFYNGGVAVLSETMQVALVEFFDEFDDPAYIDSAHFTARKMFSIDDEEMSNTVSNNSFSSAYGTNTSLNSSPSCSAIITQIPTDEYAQVNGCSYCTLAVLPRLHTSSQHPEIFLATTKHSVLVADTYSLSIIDLDCGQRIRSNIVSMTFAPNGRFLACFTNTSILTVISTNFETEVLVFDTSEGSASAPNQMKWCGEDSVVLYWKNLGVLMIGPFGDWFRYPYDFTDDLFLLPEMDCCRIVTDSSTDIIQRVPPSTASFLRIGSIEPSAMLLDASDAFENGSPASDEAARAVNRTGLLVDAIETCAEAAMKEFDVPVQKRLLRAASYGMHFVYKDQLDQRKTMGGDEKVDFDALESADPDGNDEDQGNSDTGVGGSRNENLAKVRPSPTGRIFVAAAKKVRILNALRNPAVGFAMTSAQFDAVTPTGIVARLVEAKRPSLATTIATYLDLHKSVQTFARVSRAAAFIASDKEQSDTRTAEGAMRLLKDDVLGLTTPKDASKIGNINSTKNSHKKFAVDQNVLGRGGYASVALAAKSVGRPEVGKLLLRLETSIPDKVKGLVSIEAYDGAISVASDAKDADLMFLSLLEFEKNSKDSDIDPMKGQQRFFSSIVSKCPPEATNLMKSYYSSIRDVKSIMSLNLRAQKQVEAGSFMAKHALMQSVEQDRITMLKEASRVYGMNKDGQFHKTCTNEYLDLLFEQERLRKAYKSPLIAPESSSVSETIRSIIFYARESPAMAPKIFQEGDRLARKFNVPDKRLWNIKIKSLADSEQWAQLRILSETKEKKTIGFKPFALAAIKGKQPISEINRYIERVNTPEDRYDLFCEAKLWKRALDEAQKLKDPNKVMSVSSMCNSPEIRQTCDDIFAQMT